MKWNIAAECVSVVILSIIWAYSRKGTTIPSLKNRVFQLCFLATFCAMITNILSTLMLAYPQYIPTFLTYLFTLIYFATTPLMGLAYYFYAVAVVYEQRGGGVRACCTNSVPGAVYLLLALSNPFTSALFSITAEGVYSRGPWVGTTYIVFYYYCLSALLLVLVRRKWIDPDIRNILASFPIIAFIVIFIQQMFPDIILSGSAATCAILLIYLYLQNKQISIDYLTGLPNRQEFLKMLELILRSGSGPFAVVVLSLRDFKQINDTFGQQSGDAFLKAIGDYLQKVAAPRCLYRYSGDEFVLLMRNTSEARVETGVLALADRMAEPWNTGDLNCIIQAVIGVVSYPESAQTPEGLVHGIEYAVSKAKSGRKGPLVHCGKEMLEEINRHAQVIEILQENLKADSFVLYYQPILSTSKNRFVLAESLLRIPKSPLGPIFPNEFIPLAEETGMIVEMTYQILNQACRYVACLEEVCPDFEGIHVNFSGVQFTQPDLEEKVTAILQKNGTPFDKIKIEITESVLVENTGTVIEFAKRMQSRGAMLGLDDFGTGYSNFVSVLDTPLDIIKIDKSLLWSAIENKRSEVMLRSLVRLFHELGLSVLVEGVETGEQDALVRDCGVDLIQGYYYAKPMPGPEMLSILKAQREAAALTAAAVRG